MKRFIDFEIILILVIILLSGTFYIAIYLGTRELFEPLEQTIFTTKTQENKTTDIAILVTENYFEILLKDNLNQNNNEDSKLICHKEYKEAFIEIDVFFFVIVNIIAGFNWIIDFIKSAKYSIAYKDLKNDYKTSTELPNYSPLVARAILKKEVYFSSMVLKRYFRELDILDKEGNIIKSNIDKLDVLEKVFLEEYKKNGFEDFEAIEKIIYNKLEELNFLKHKSIKTFLMDFTYFPSDENNTGFSIMKLKRKLIIWLVALTLILACSFLSKFINAYTLLIIMGAVVPIMMFKLDKITLNKNGMIERVRLKYLRRNLEKADSLSEREKHFLFFIE